MNTRQSPHNDQRAIRDRRRAQARRRGITLLAIVLVVILVIVLAIVTTRGDSTGGTTTTSTTDEFSTTTSGDGSDTSDTVEGTDTTGDTTETTDAATTGTTTYTVDATGGNQVPQVDTAASATLTLKISADGTSVNYVFKVNSIIDLTVARLRQGKSGATGPVIFTVYGGPLKDGLHSGTIKTGSFTADDLVGPLKGKTIEDFVALIEQENVYMNVGTKSHSDGEVRGQVQ